MFSLAYLARLSGYWGFQMPIIQSGCQFTHYQNISALEDISLNRGGTQECVERFDWAQVGEELQTFAKLKKRLFGFDLKRTVITGQATNSAKENGITLLTNLECFV